MRKAIKLMLWLVLLCISMPQAIMAQAADGRGLPRIADGQASLADIAAARRQIPALIAVAPQQGSVFKTALSAAGLKCSQGANATLAAAGGAAVTLQGAVVNASNWGYYATHYGVYQFAAASPLEPAVVFENSQIRPNAGGVMIDGTLHYFWYASYYGQTQAYYYTCSHDGDEWSAPVSTRISDFSLLAPGGLAADPATGKVYGIFYTSGLDGQELGSIDFSSMKKTSIAAMPTQMLAFAIDNGGQAYAISATGDLYRIDKQTGAAAKVGATGVEPAAYVQSATIDPKSGRMFWAAYTKDNKSVLYEVNTTTGAATEIGAFPNSEEIGVLYVPVPEAEDGAPSAVSDLTALFKNGQTTGEVSFTVPVETFGGSTLAGEVSYAISVNGTEVKHGKAMPGAKVTEEVTTEGGETQIVVACSNSAGAGPKAKCNLWTGYDEPQAVTNLAIVLDGTTARLSWTAPAEGVHGGYMGPLTYNIVRYPDAATVATGISSTTYSETLPDGALKAYNYEVVPVNGTVSGHGTKSGSVVAGKALDTPYRCNFDTQNDFDIFTVIDANNDGETWGYSASDGSAIVAGSNKQSGDDWLLTPPLNLKADHIYSISFKAKNGMGKWVPEKFRLAYGVGTDPSAYTMLIDMVELESDKYADYSAQITPDKAGEYRFGFHYVSDAKSFMMSLDSIDVEDVASTNGPEAVADIKATAAAKGQLAATVSFKAPEKTIKGNDLTSISRIEVWRDDSELVQTVTNPAPGSSLSVSDEHAHNGFNKYSVVAYNAAGNGKRAEATVYVGIDTPTAPASATLSDNADGTLNLTWPAPSTQGVNGGFVDPDKLTYNIFKVADDGYSLQVVKEGVAGNSYTVQNVDQSGNQRLTAYIVAAVSENGQGGLTTSNSIVIGEAYTLPFRESLPGGYLENKMWWSDKTGNNAFGSTTDIAYDNDKGCVFWRADKSGDQTWLNSGKIALGQAKAPKLVFRYYTRRSLGNETTLDVDVVAPSGKRTAVHTIKYNEVPKQTGWQTAVIDLDAFRQLPYITLSFHATAKIAEGYLVQPEVAFDRIEVYDVAEHDLSAVLSSPSTVAVGHAADNTVRLYNRGSQTATGYTVRLYNGKKEIASAEGSDIPAYGYADISLPYTPAVTDGTQLNLTAYADYAADKNTEDNTSDVQTVKLQQPDYPAISDLALKGNSLKWSAPDVGSGSVTEDFDGYDPFVINDFSPKWTCVDGDKKNTYTFGNNHFTNEGKPMAFITFNPAELGIDTESKAFLKPHSGNQFIADFNAMGAQCDDWLISPELSGKAQTVSFWAKGLTADYSETFEVYCSTITNTVDAMTLVKSATTVAGGDTWTQYEVELPEGARFFAIHVVSEDCFAFLLDDVTYEPLQLVVKGYNVYCDGELVTTLSANETAFDVTASGTGHAFNVTVVYNLGESALSNTVSAATGIADIDADGSEGTVSARPGIVYGISGQQLGRVADRSSVGRDVFRHGIIIVNGRKMVSK